MKTQTRNYYIIQVIELDITSAIMDPELGCSAFTVERLTYTRTAEGTTSRSVTYQAMGCVHPGTPEMIQLLPEEERHEEFIAIYTDFALSLGADHSTAQFINRFSSILMGYTDRGVLASGLWRGTPSDPLQTGDTVENGFALWADSYDDQPDADRAAHKAVPVQVGLVLAGSIESIVITVNVMV